ncbi:MAG: methyltransferase [Gammaproteobacteria bacterium]|nr:methyltransferase [Gammaproteobacteria bacterium]
MTSTTTGHQGHHLEHLLIAMLNDASTDAQGATLWIVDENLAPAQLQAIHPRANLLAITNRFEVGEALRAAGQQVLVNDFDFAALPVTSVARIVYRVSKERALVHHCINEGYKLLAPGGSLNLLGHKDDGIKTHGKNGEQLFRSKAQLQKHGIAYCTTLRKFSQLANANPEWLDSKDYPRLRPCQVGALEFISKPGVFGWNKIDHGSELLAREARQVLHGRAALGSVLDLGCGYGYLLLVTADLPFAKRSATDNNAVAVLAATTSFAKQQLSVGVTLDDCGEHLQERFDVILCNPPFHQGFSTSNALAEKFLTEIRRLLSDKGIALLVVNQFIPVEKVAAEHFQNISTLCLQDGFKVVQLS